MHEEQHNDQLAAAVTSTLVPWKCAVCYLRGEISTGFELLEEGGHEEGGEKENGGPE